MKFKIILLSLIFLFFTSAAFAGSPNYIDPDSGGKAYRWPKGNITVWLDAGGMTKNITYEEARTIIREAGSVWERALINLGDINSEMVDVSTIDFRFLGPLEDIDEENYRQYFFRGEGADDIDRPTVIIFDKDGAIMEDLIAEGVLPDGADLSIYGLTDLYALDNESMTIINGTVILNGKKLSTDRGKEVQRAVITHELGHLLNLDHSAVNDRFVEGNECGEFCNYLPTMYRLAITPEQNDLHYDDKAWIGYLYNRHDPGSDIMRKLCYVSGQIFDIGDLEGKQLGFQGAQVTAWEMTPSGKVNDAIAVSAITGSYYPVCSYEGDYVIPGLRPGKEYMIQYGPIPNFCEGYSPGTCGLGSGINPYAPPRDLESGEVKHKLGDEGYVAEDATVFKCEEGGINMEARPVTLSVDLDKDEYVYYNFSGVDFTCSPEEGKVVLDDPGEEANDPYNLGWGLKKGKGWCSLVHSREADSISFFIFLPVIVLFITRFKYKKI